MGISEDIESLRERVKREPDDANVLHTLGAALCSAAGEPREGLVFLRRALEAGSDVPAEVLNDIGLAHMALKDYAAALESFRSGIQQNPSFLPLRVNAGNALRYTNDHAGAMVEYREAAKLNPADVAVLSNLGSTLAFLGQSAEAKDCFEKVLEKEPKNAVALLKLGEIAEESDDPDGAIKLLEKALKQNPSEPRVHFALGQAYEKKANVARAIASYRKAVELDQHAFDWFLALGVLQYHSGFIEDSVQSFERASELDPSHANTHNHLGIAYQALQQQQAALSHFTRAVELDSGHAAGVANLGHVLDDMGLYEEAVERFLRAVRLDGTQASWYKKMGVSYTHLEQFDKAVDAFYTGLAIDERDATIHYNVAAAYGKQAKLPPAAFHAQLCVECDPDLAPGRSMCDMLRPHVKDADIAAFKPQYEGRLQLLRAKYEAEAARREAEAKAREDREAAAQKERKELSEQKMLERAAAERKRAEEEAKRKEEERKRKEEEERKRRAEEERKRKEQEAAERKRRAAEQKRLDEERAARLAAEKAQREAEAAAQREAEAAAAKAAEEAARAAAAEAAAEEKLKAEMAAMVGAERQKAEDEKKAAAAAARAAKAAAAKAKEEAARSAAAAATPPMPSLPPPLPVDADPTPRGAPPLPSSAPPLPSSPPPTVAEVSVFLDTGVHIPGLKKVSTIIPLTPTSAYPDIAAMLRERFNVSDGRKPPWALFVVANVDDETLGCVAELENMSPYETHDQLVTEGVDFRYEFRRMASAATEDELARALAEAEDRTTSSSKRRDKDRSSRDKDKDKDKDKDRSKPSRRDKDKDKDKDRRDRDRDRDRDRKSGERPPSRPASGPPTPDTKRSHRDKGSRRESPSSSDGSSSEPPRRPAPPPVRDAVAGRLQELPRPTKRNWQASSPVSDILREYATCLSGLPKRERDERVRSLGDNTQQRAWPPGVTDAITVPVLVGGRWERVPPRTLVPGDMVLLLPDEVLEADVRIVHARRLAVDRSALGGPSKVMLTELPVPKVSSDDDWLAAKSVALQGDVIVGGRGVGVVVQTGSRTALSKKGVDLKLPAHVTRTGATSVFDDHTKDLVRDLKKHNDLHVINEMAVPRLGTSSLVLFQPSTLLTSKVTIKSVFYDKKFVQAPIIKWIAAQEKLSVLTKAAGTGGGKVKQRLSPDCSAEEAFAAAEYKLALEKVLAEPENAKQLFNVASIRLAAGSYEEAKEMFTKSLEKDSYSAISYFCRGNAHLATKAYALADDDYKKASVMLRGNDFVDYGQMGLNFRLLASDILLNKALSAAYQGDFDEATGSLEEARECEQVRDPSLLASLLGLFATRQGGDALDEVQPVSVGRKLFDLTQQRDVNAGPRANAGMPNSATLHSRPVFETLRKLVVLCSTGERLTKPKRTFPDWRAMLTDEDKARLKKKSELVELKKRMMEIAGQVGAAQAAAKADPENHTAKAEVTQGMKEMVELKSKISVLEREIEGNDVRGGKLLSLKDAQREVSRRVGESSTDVANKLKAWSVADRLAFAHEWEVSLAETLDTLAPHLAEMHEEHELLHVGTCAPGAPISYKALWRDRTSPSMKLLVVWRGSMGVAMEKCDRYLSSDGSHVPLTEAMRATFKAEVRNETRVEAYCQSHTREVVDLSGMTARDYDALIEESMPGSAYAGAVVMKEEVQQGVDLALRRLLNLGVKVGIVSGRDAASSLALARKVGLDFADFDVDGHPPSASAGSSVVSGGSHIGRRSVSGADSSPSGSRIGGLSPSSTSHSTRSVSSDDLAVPSGSPGAGGGGLDSRRRASSTSVTLEVPGGMDASPGGGEGSSIRSRQLRAKGMATLRRAKEKGSVMYASGRVKAAAAKETVRARALEAKASLEGTASLCLSASHTLEHLSFLKRGAQLVIHSASDDFVPLIQRIADAQLTAVFVADTGASLSMTQVRAAGGVSVALARAPTHLLTLADIVLAGNTVEDISFALEAVLLMRIEQLEFGGVVALCPEARPERQEADAVRKVTVAFHGEFQLL